MRSRDNHICSMWVDWHKRIANQHCPQPSVGHQGKSPDADHADIRHDADRGRIGTHGN